MPSQRIDHSGMTYRFPSDFPGRFRRGPGQSGTETGLPPGHRPSAREGMTTGPREPGERVPAALYARSADGDPDNTLATHLESLQRYASGNGLDPVRVYFDTRGSRSKFDRMMSEAAWENPPFRCILASDHHRFAGSEQEYQDLSEWLKERGVSVVSITNPPGDARAG